MITNPDGKPYAHNAEQAEAAKIQAISTAAAREAVPDALDNQTRVIESLKDRVRLLDATVTACHAAMLGKVHPKSPAWKMIYAVQDDEWKSSEIAIPHPTTYENP